MFASMGGALPWPTAVLVALGPWLAVPLAAMDVLLFWGFFWLARKYWIGLLFAPLFAAGLLTAPIVWALYLPMFEVITLVK
jgi:type II secretory pathway component PulF